VDRPRVHFLHVGKTGGTAIRYGLQGHLAGARYELHFHPHHTTLGQIPPGERVVFYLRDPISRFVSGFYSRQRRGQPRYFVDWRPAERKAFARFETPNQLAVALSSHDPREQHQARQAMRAITHVRTFYSDWFGNRAFFLSRLQDVFFIGFQETLSDDFECLKRKLGVDPAAALPNDDINAHRNPSTVNRDLEWQAIVNLRAWYAEDDQFVDLCKGIAKRVNTRS
jgi:hypothetical protein